MNRKEKPLSRRFFETLSSFALIGACGYAFFAGMNLLVGFIIASAVLSLITPVIFDGGDVIELILGVFEAFIDGLMGVIDAIASIFFLNSLCRLNHSFLNCSTNTNLPEVWRAIGWPEQCKPNARADGSNGQSSYQ